MKHVTFLIFVIPLLFACNATRKTVSNSDMAKESNAASKQPEMLNHISVTPKTSSAPIGNTVAMGNMNSLAEQGLKNNRAFNIEQMLPLQFKYAVLLNTEVEKIYNIKLFSFIEDWYGTRYKYGGSSKQGIDCSGFTSTLYEWVFENGIARTSREQFDQSEKINKADLKEGDLVFFNTRGGVSHVGVYLFNDKFVHASTSGGVMISDLNEPYYAKRFIGGGRKLNNQ